MPRTLADLGAEIIPIGCSPNGRNINDGCGSTAPGLLQLTVPGVRAVAGIALDGDGDRLVMVDGLGRIVDGDQLIYIIATARKRAGTLQGPVVGHGDEQSRARSGAARAGHRVQARARSATVTCSACCARPVARSAAKLRPHLLLDKTTTGDALMAALQVLAVMRETGRGLAELAAGHAAFSADHDQRESGQRFDPKTVPEVEDTVQRVALRLGATGRVVLRPSGTEPVIRVMVEARDETDTRALCRGNRRRGAPRCVLRGAPL